MRIEPETLIPAARRDISQLEKSAVGGGMVVVGSTGDVSADPGEIEKSGKSIHNLCFFPRPADRKFKKLKHGKSVSI